MTEDEVSEICKALSDPNRLKIIKLLVNGGDQCGCKLLEEFNITQPTLSHHMKILSECGLVTCEKSGKKTVYSIKCCTFNEYKSYFEKISFCKDK